jgi:hypothetical protein
VRGTLILIGLLAGGCDPSQPPAEGHDRATLEATVADCDRAAARSCDAARKALADKRREDRMAAYRQVF